MNIINISVTDNELLILALLTSRQMVRELNQMVSTETPHRMFALKELNELHNKLTQAEVSRHART